MLEDGQILQNRYVIEKQIGAGGMGTVFIATDQRFNNQVAIKETLFSDANLLRAFEREAQLLNSLRHPVLPRVSDYFTEGDEHFLVMEYIAGEDLAKMLDEGGAFPFADVRRWTDELLDALDYLHTQEVPVIHRDIKPQNLKLTARSEIILLDFGLAKGFTHNQTQSSTTRSIFGYSRNYAPLEQIQGTGTDTRSDLYSLAATVYNLATGQPPTDALTRATAVLSGDVDPLKPAREVNPRIPQEFSDALTQALNLNQNARFATAAEMRGVLAAVPIGEAEENTILRAPRHTAHVVEVEQKSVPPIAVNPNPAPARVVKIGESRSNRSPLPFGIAAAILLLGGGAAGWYALSNPSKNRVVAAPNSAAVNSAAATTTTRSGNAKTNPDNNKTLVVNANSATAAPPKPKSTIELPPRANVSKRDSSTQPREETTADNQPDDKQSTQKQPDENKVEQPREIKRPQLDDNPPPKPTPQPREVEPNEGNGEL